MKNKYLKSLVEKLRELDEKMKKDGINVSHPSRLDKAKITEDDLLPGEIEILEALKQYPNEFLSIETKFFKDFGFIADAIEIASAQQYKASKIAAKHDKKAFAGQRFDDKKALDIEIKEFTTGIRLKCAVEYEILTEAIENNGEEMGKKLGELKDVLRPTEESTLEDVLRLIEEPKTEIE